MQFQVLGPLEVTSPSGPVRIGGAKKRQLLALLLMHAKEVVDADTLIDGLWGDSPPEGSGHALEAAVSRLRSLLDPGRIATQSLGYQIRVGQDELDLHRFDRLVREAHRARSSGDVARAVTLLREATELWRGRPLPELGGGAYERPELVRLEELRLSAIEALVDARVELGEGPELVAELESLVREHPFREHLQAQLMRVLYRSGRQADALRVFATVRRMLVDELAIEPGPELQALQIAILNQHEALTQPPTRSAPADQQPRTILVAGQPTDDLGSVLRIATLLGRAGDVAAIAAVVADQATDLGAAVRAANGARAELAESAIVTRAAGFVSQAPGSDIVRVCQREDVTLVLIRGPRVEEGGRFGAFHEAILGGSPADVGIVVEGRGSSGWPAEAIVAVPFGGTDDDWAAVELAVAIATRNQARLTLVGFPTQAHDAASVSRLLADASLLVQRVAPLMAEPRLAAEPAQALDALGDANLVIAGLAGDWRRVGLGASRARIASEIAGTMLLIRRGVRPGLLAPPEGRTAYSWSIGLGALS
jgi:DNA-binding SARP family transcriptional activator